ncbi:mechanosensitive ion channel family protein [Prevotella sp. HUN102]|uniref:mechanosensitive ion channel family protein n=1 Tax=Prevotella sp. HUN102 TaxID=1392486 RepID=UPI00048B021F|nr:mechanosensitive ion channel domain-containing protein [Prevotella sp. HUN102]
MERIRIFVEELLSSMGVADNSVAVIRHIVLVVGTILLAWLLDYLCRKLVVPVLLRITARTKAKWDDIVFDRSVICTACHIVPAIVVWEFLPMVFYQFPTIQEILTRLTAVYITVNATRLMVKIIDRFRFLNTKAGSSSSQYLKSFCGVLKIVMIFIAVVVVVAILIDKNPMTLFAGLGATSAILMLVFKDTIEGLVAGVRLTSNEMVHIGDWITVPGTPVDGNVIDITLTTVKVRQFDNTITTVPPLTLVNGTFQNWKGMQESNGRQVKRVVYFDVRSIRAADESLKAHLAEKGYLKSERMEGDVVNMGLFRTYLESYLRAHEEVNSEMTVMVRQKEATQSGIPVELYFFVLNKEWVSYEGIVSDILEHVYAYANEFGLKIYEQFPVQ